MGVGAIITSALLLVFSVVIIIIVLLQEGQDTSLSGAVAGGSDSFLGKNKGRTVDALLAKWTKFFAIGFFILTLLCDIFTLNK